MDRQKILLFISKESPLYQFTRRQVEVACDRAFGKHSEPVLEVIDIAENPEMAERYNIESLPTLCVGEKRFSGELTPEALASYLDVSAAPAADRPAANRH